MTDSALQRAADLIQKADGLIVAAGAGMGVDSGLPDFRGPEGFWQAYPALGKRRLRFEDMADPLTFFRQPRLAWGFYGHRMNLYRRTKPHEGFALLQRIGQTLKHGLFAYTSNVDGQFQKAGFRDSRVCEIHGSIHHLQCMKGCLRDAWSADVLVPVIDEDECLWTAPLPTCPHCGGLARPNILLFADGDWLPERTAGQRAVFDLWRREVQQPVVIEVGAGTAIASIRRFSEAQGCPLIRINLRDAEVPRGHIGIESGALDALLALSGTLGTYRC